MKIAQCKYAKAGVEISLNLYFDLKVFEFINPVMNLTQEEELIRLTCDSFEAALPKENATKNFYIKRIVKVLDDRLRLFCSDGFLIDDALTLRISPQAYSSERIKLSEVDQLPIHFKLSNDLLKTMNDRLPLFEEMARKNIASEIAAISTSAVKLTQPKPIIREFTTEKSFEALSSISRLKKEIRDMTENTLKSLDHALKQNPDNPEKLELIKQKINEITPVNEKFSEESDDIIKKIKEQTTKLTAFKQTVIRSLYEAAQEFSLIVATKMKDAALHERKILQNDFNRKFQEIAILSDTGELSSWEVVENNLEKLSLEDLQDVISNDKKDAPGLLQKCNTSFTEESPELKIVMKHLGQLNKNLLNLLKDDPKVANKEMTQITRIPVPRSFQFKFTDNAIQYKNIIDDFCKTQKEIAMNLVNSYKKILQISNLDILLPKKVSFEPIKPAEELTDLQKRKVISDSILHAASKDHHITKKHQKKIEQFNEMINKNIDGSLKLLMEKIKITTQRMQTEAESADGIMHELTTAKNQIDIKINHYILHPDTSPDFKSLDNQITNLEEKRNLLLSKNKSLIDASNKLSSYEKIIKRIQDIDLFAIKNTLGHQRTEAKQLLLQAMQNPVFTEKNKQRSIEQYAKVDANAADIDKSMTEIINMQSSLFEDMDHQPDISTEKLESKFQGIAQKMQTLSSMVNLMNENVSTLKKINLESLT
jgi:hypothetical protein